MTGHAVFDLDGTLVDSVGICADILNSMLIDRGLSGDISVARARGYVSMGGTRMVEGLLGDACGDPTSEIAEFRARYASLPTPRSSLFPGVREALAALWDDGVRLSICSAKPQHLCEKVLIDLELDNLFDVVVGSAPGRPVKPDPEHLFATLRLANGGRERSCFIGDSEVDHALAVAAGVPIVLMTTGYLDPASDISGAILVDNFSEIPTVVSEILGLRSGSPPAWRDIAAPQPLRADGSAVPTDRRLQTAIEF